MRKRIGFDNEKYIELQTARIRDRIATFGGKLYLEFGGKLFDDYHASRVLPGFEPDTKLRMLQSMVDDVEIILVINANRYAKFETFPIWNLPLDHPVNIAYEAATLDLSDVNAIDHIVSDEGMGKNDYIETSRPLVVVSAPGPGSGKMATCLSQLYHDHKHGVSAGYAKFETFPIWNLPLDHPVNIAYEAATLDLSDVNAIDPFHLEAYGETTVNYNRDIEIYPVLKAMFEKIVGESPYKSPTDMGVNMAGLAISDDEVCRDAANHEIVRRYFQTATEAKRTGVGDELVAKAEMLMKKAGVDADLSPARAAALAKAEQSGGPAGAMELPDGRIITGKTSTLLGAASSVLLNALKAQAGIDDELYIIADAALEPICNLRTEQLGHTNPRLHPREMLIALSTSSLTSPMAAKAIQAAGDLRGCDVYFSVIISSDDEQLYRSLGINVCCEPRYEQHRYYHS